MRAIRVRGKTGYEMICRTYWMILADLALRFFLILALIIRRNANSAFPESAVKCTVFFHCSRDISEAGTSLLKRQTLLRVTTFASAEGVHPRAR